jgi:membrane-associated phospholipid phosphatase
MIRPIRSYCVCSCLTVAILSANAGPAAAQTLAPVAAAAPVFTPAQSVTPSTAPTLAPALPGLKSLLTESVTDFRHLASKESVTWLTVGLVGASIARTMDQSTSRALSGSSGADRVLGLGATIGSAHFQIAGALATYGVGRATGQARVAEVGADLVRANIVAQALTTGIKMSVRRGRPDGTEYSFPSGHASVSFATATVLQQHFGWSVGVPAYAAASYVAASRVQDKRHYLSDVAFGAVVGIVVGRSVTVGHGNHRFAVEPMVPGSGGFGVAFVKK